ncbi:MAG: EAL domain-containing protein [Cyanobacteria bacterium SBLK]|nr:EAL domain-containing protein [Cyanobacteria bacterium SBLK]
MTKILTIEDDENIRDSLLDVLGSEGYDLIAAANGRCGLQLAREEFPDLILCDLILPELNGYEILQSIRQSTDLANTPFIFLTGKVEKEYFRQGMELGADDYLTKPFTLSELLGAIETQLQKRDRLSARLRQAEHQIDYLLHHDPLVCLPNRLSLRKWLSERVLPETQNLEDAEIDLCVLAIDRFDRLQQTLSHQGIESILQSVAQRLQCYRSHSIHLAYFNLNQFVFLLYNGNVRSFTREILNDFRHPFFVRDRELLLTASIGIAVKEHNYLSLNALIDRAEIAKTHARHQGGDRIQYYTPSLYLDSLERSFLETHVPSALEKQELQVYYQPQVSSNNGEIIGMEALMRWFHPQKGSISPARFIPVAENLGSIVEMGEWILYQACQQVRDWQEKYNKHFSLAVNLSVRQLQDAQFCDRLRKILRETQFSANCLELELTESMLVDDVRLTQQKINELKSLGIAIAIDDFGTGYGSLNYLQQFSFDVVKIDRCFIQDLDGNATNAAIVTTIVEMAKRLNCKAIAEGVSTAADLSFLQKQGCYALQGYFLSQPLPSSEFAALLDTGGIFTLPNGV